MEASSILSSLVSMAVQYIQKPRSVFPDIEGAVTGYDDFTWFHLVKTVRSHCSGLFLSWYCLFTRQYEKKPGACGWKSTFTSIPFVPAFYPRNTNQSLWSQEVSQSRNGEWTSKTCPSHIVYSTSLASQDRQTLYNEPTTVCSCLWTWLACSTKIISRSYLHDILHEDPY